MPQSIQTKAIKDLTLTDTDLRLKDWWELTKPRLSLMSVATAILGYFAAGPDPDPIRFMSLFLGTTLAAFGCGVLNQWLEREADARMARTADRAMAAGRIEPFHGFLFGVALSAFSLVVMAYGVNLAATLLTLATILLYLLAYTPLKRKTPWATEIGAVPGALPPLIGWVAAGGGFSSMGWVLFAILFAWQLPHFMAICWMCRQDYEQGGFRMLSSVDKTGRRVARKALVWTILLVGLSLLPLREPEIGWTLLVVALVLGYAHIVPAIRFLMKPDHPEHARKLFLVTLVYLPVFLGALVVDRFFV